MKKYGMLIGLASLIALGVCAQEEPIGEEYIKPLKYPKFSIAGQMDINGRFHGFADKSLRMPLKNRYEAVLSFEAGLLKYFNAGALFSATLPLQPSEPIATRFGLFAKPYFPIKEIFSIFTRFSLGTSASFQSAYAYFKNQDTKNTFDTVFLGQEFNGPYFGGFASATIGVEFFFFSRMGLAFEGGIKTSLLKILRSVPFGNVPATVANAPTSVNFWTYEIPLAVTLHFIL